MEASPRAVGTVDWVPDDQVQECPLCTRKFTKTIRKHHCRACGRVCCGYCSENKLQLPGSNRKERVCDQCFDLRQHEFTGSLTEDHGTTKILEQSLKAELKQKLDQAQWFKGFLVRISGQTFGAEKSDVAMPPASELDESKGQLPSTASPQETEIFDAEMQKLVSGAQTRFRQVCAELRRRQADTTAARSECEKVEGECQRLKAESTDLRKSMKGMESDLKRQPEVLVEREELQRRVRDLEEELAGLTRRTVLLEADRPSSSSHSLLTFSGSEASCTRMRERMDDCRGSVARQCVLM